MTDTWVQSATIRARPYGGGVSNLQCPRCDAELLHHSGVTIYDRKEDAALSVVTTVQGGHVEVDPAADGIGNPSNRRDGLVISFTCEGCGDDPIELTIAQHKGSTEIGWRFLRKEP